jgi:two-component system, LuxR family, sensor kinase FixL
MADSLTLPKAGDAVGSLPLIGAYLLAYVALDWVSYIYPIAPLGITPWNPPPGLSLALLLRYGLRNGPWLMVAAFAAEILVRGAPAPLAWLALSSALLAGGYTLLAWLLLVPLRFGMDFRSLRDAAIFTSVVTVTTAVLAVAYVETFNLAGVLPPGLLLKSVAQFWIGDLIGIVVTTPLLLILTRRDSPWAGLRLWEALAHVLAIALTLWVVFALGVSQELNLFYLLFLPLIWVAMRHGLPGTTVATLLIQLGLIAALQLGGFAAATVLQFQFLLLALAVTGIFLGAAISERRQAEMRLREQQLDLDRSLRLAAASELASALAHELNQPLSAITTYVRACQVMATEDGSSREPLGKTMDKVVQEVTRASRVVRRLREFFRAGSMQLEPLNVEQLLRSALAAEQQRTERHRVSCSIDCSVGLPQVLADRVQIEIVLHNLLANAIDALKENAVEGRAIRLIADGAGERLVRVAVADSGPGITKEIAEQLLHPFLTSKPSGMGLGLAISRSIVEAHGGGLSIEAGRSGMVSFTLPIAS